MKPPAELHTCCPHAGGETTETEGCLADCSDQVERGREFWSLFSPRNRSRSPSFEFRPEDREWLEEVLLQPLVSCSVPVPARDVDNSVLTKGNRLDSTLEDEGGPGAEGPIPPAGDSQSEGKPLEDMVAFCRQLASTPLQVPLGKSLLQSKPFDGEPPLDGVPAEANAPDFIATADEMKKIFQVSYRDQEVSILMHRVGGTLHLDGDFDVSCLAAEDGLQESAAATGQGELPSSFMCYSITGGKAEDADCGALRELRASLRRERARRRETDGKDIRRVFQWQFQDVAMLLGSESVIIARSEHRRVRMQARDVEEQISCEACLDLWLDNLMAGAQELALCYHKEGVMQGYQLLETDEIPSLVHCHHLATECHRNAAQLLSLIKERCNQDGSSYVLRKTRGSAQIQIFRVRTAGGKSSLEGEAPDWQGNESSGSADGGESRGRLLFSYPMAILCYRMAMKLIDGKGLVAASHCQRLLRQCISLLDAPEHPRLWATANARLAEVLAREEDAAGGEARPRGGSWSLVERKGRPSPEQPRHMCLGIAAGHIGRAINCLSFYEPGATSQLARMHVQAAELFALMAEECNRADMAGRAFRMVSFAAHHMSAATGCSERREAGSGWERHLTRRLLASSARSHKSLAELLVGPEGADASADARHAMYRHRQDLRGLSPGSVVAHNGEDAPDGAGARFLGAAARDLSSDVETNLNYAVQHYLGALKLFKDHDGDDTEYRKMASSLGEVYRQLGAILKNSGRFTKAYQHFQQGIPLFNSVGAQLCVAQSHLELARLSASRIRGMEFDNIEAIGELTSVTLRTIESFKAALASLGGRRADHSIWEAAKTELAEVLVFAAGTLQAGMPLSKEPEEVGQMAADMYRDAIKSYSEVSASIATSKAGVPADEGRAHCVANAAASIHHQTARLHGQLAKLAQPTKHEAKSVRQGRMLSLALSHLDKALVQFTIDGHPVHHTMLQVDAAALVRQVPLEKGRIRALESALDRLFGCAAAFQPTRHCSGGSGGACACGMSAAEAAAAAESELGRSHGDASQTCPSLAWGPFEVELNLLLRELIQARSAAAGPSGPGASTDCLRSMYKTSLTQREHRSPWGLLAMLCEQNDGRRCQGQAQAGGRRPR
uniref:Erythroid differentiation-related factor n=1 Tax=Tetraselmis sp. GSL018 TaxID=582737 RepID=A0A061R901_9CHLO